LRQRDFVPVCRLPVRRRALPLRGGKKKAGAIAPAFVTRAEVRRAATCIACF